VNQILRNLRLIIYPGNTLETNGDFPDLGQNLVSGESITLCRDMTDFTPALKLPGFKVVVIAVQTSRELEDIFGQKDWLEGQAVILVLTARDQEIRNRLMIRGLKLAPKYIASSPCEYTNVRLVLKKIIHNHGGTYDRQ
jgi:hypothetical protein